MKPRLNPEQAPALGCPHHLTARPGPARAQLPMRDKQGGTAKGSRMREEQAAGHPQRRRQEPQPRGRLRARLHAAAPPRSPPHVGGKGGGTALPQPLATGAPQPEPSRRATEEAGRQRASTAGRQPPPPAPPAEPPPSPPHLGSACCRSPSSAPCSRPGREGRHTPALGSTTAQLQPPFVLHCGRAGRAGAGRWAWSAALWLGRPRRRGGLWPRSAVWPLGVSRSRSPSPGLKALQVPPQSLGLGPKISLHAVYCSQVKVLRRE